MKHSDPSLRETYPDAHHDVYSRTVFGFWLYLLSDFILFGTLFASYLVLRRSTFGGPSVNELTHLNPAFLQTLLILVCSFTMGLAGAYAHRRNKNGCLVLMAVTFVFGTVFFWMQLSELFHHVQAGNGWEKSAFLSSYFTLIGTHAVHVIFALLWLIVLGLPILREGITSASMRRVTCLRMFWQFINIVWVFIFSFVYVLGGIL